MTSNDNDKAVMIDRNHILANLQQLSLLLGVGRPAMNQAFKKGIIKTKYFTSRNLPLFDTSKIQQIRSKIEKSNL